MSALIVDASSWLTIFSNAVPSVIDEGLAEGGVYFSPIVAADLISGKMSTRQRLAEGRILTHQELKERITRWRMSAGY